MDISARISEAETILQPLVEHLSYQEEYRLDAHLSVNKLIDAINVLRKAQWLHLTAITGLDLPSPGPVSAGAPVTENPPALQDMPENSDLAQGGGRVELLYHFCDGPAIVTLRTSVPYSDAVVPSICGILPHATLYERELIEMFGVTFTNTTETTRLLLPDDWPDGVYPLRKSFKG